VRSGASGDSDTRSVRITVTEYAVDTFAWIEYFAGTPIGERARTIIEDSGNRLVTPAPMLAEVRSKFIREGLDPEPPTLAIESLSEVVPLDRALARSAGEEHARQRKTSKDFGMMDAFLLVTARSRSARVLTGDPHFRGLAEVEFLE